MFLLRRYEKKVKNKRLKVKVWGDRDNRGDRGDREDKARVLR